MSLLQGIYLERTALWAVTTLLRSTDVVLLGEGGLRLAPRMVWTDVAAFGSLEARAWTDLPGSRRNGDLTGGRQSDEGSDEAFACAQRAIALYRGPLLGTLALSAPARALSEQLARRFSRLVIGHGRALETRGHWREAADVYEQGLARDSLAEPIYRALMRVLLQLGERAEAMRTFARCRDLLTSALGVTPSRETWALREQAAGPQP